MAERVYTVSEVNNLIKGVLEREPQLANLQVVGEISNFKRYPSGHCYFTLKDAGGVLKCVLFRSKAVRLRFEPKNGDTVLVIGRIAVYERDGIYQLYADLLLQQGVGDLTLEYEKLKRRLEAEGLFAAERKQPLPLQPQTLGIITSPAGAAVRDMITVSRRRNAGIRLLLYPVRVQGAGAAKEIAAAIAFFNKHKLADVLIVGRGGGSIEDLWAFNEEATVRAVAASRIPIVSAVGHETDFTLCDFAADVRAATPSQAAELAVPDNEAYRRRIEQLEARCHLLIKQRLTAVEQRLKLCTRSYMLSDPRHLYQEQERRLERCLESRALRDHSLIVHRAEQRLEACLSSSIWQEPERLFAAKLQRVDMATDRLNTQLEQRLTQAEQRLAVQAARLNSLSPLAVLGRGYSVTQLPDYKLVASVEQVTWGDELVTTVSDGVITSVVQQIERRKQIDGSEENR